MSGETKLTHYDIWLAVIKKNVVFQLNKKSDWFNVWWLFQMPGNQLFSCGKNM